MRILLYHFGSYIHRDVLSCLERMGHQCKSILYKLADPYQDGYFTDYLRRYLADRQFDCVFSTNFHPLLAQICYDTGIKYLSWSYDSPVSREHLEYYALPTNYIFLFDRLEAEDFRRMGIDHVWHLPLAADPGRLSRLPVTGADRRRYACDVSFVGQFYSNPLNTLLSVQDDYVKGYVEGLTEAQLKVYGYDLLTELIDDTLLDRMNRALTSDGNQETFLTPDGLARTIGREITRRERIALLCILSGQHRVHYYSGEKPRELGGASYRGSAHYFTEMPKIFRLSKINLNPALRNIHSGISLRALDIMAAGGFLLSSLQPELLDYFEPDRDIAVYDSLEDAVCKAEYYLRHDSLREQMIQNTKKILAESFSYPDRLNTIFKTAGL